MDKTHQLSHSLVDAAWLSGDDQAVTRPAMKRAHGLRFQRALFAYHQGDYSIALVEFEKALRVAERSVDHGQIIECCTYILRILAEHENFPRIATIERQVLRLISLKDAGVTPHIKSRAHYVLGICYCYGQSPASPTTPSADSAAAPAATQQSARYDQAMWHFHEAIDYAIASDTKEALAAPLYGAATLLYARKRYPEALRELDRLSVLLSCLHLPEIASASYLLRSMVKRNIGALEEALEDAWKAFDSLKHHPHLVLYLHTLCVLGTVFQHKGDPDQARVYLNLADRSLKREEFPRIARLVDEAVASLGVKREQKADLIFDARTGLLIEKTKGEIHFEGQFVLRDLLRTFLDSPGKVLSKADLAKRVWREPYRPEVHDNKIYVTIKRLRKLLEPETLIGSKSGTRSKKANPPAAPATEYILRAKNGYFLNPKVKVLIHDQPTGSQEEKKTTKNPEIKH